MKGFWCSTCFCYMLCVCVCVTKFISCVFLFQCVFSPTFTHIRSQRVSHTNICTIHLRIYNLKWLVKMSQQWFVLRLTNCYSKILNAVILLIMLYPQIFIAVFEVRSQTKFEKFRCVLYFLRCTYLGDNNVMYIHKIGVFQESHNHAMLNIKGVWKMMKWFALCQILGYICMHIPMD